MYSLRYLQSLDWESLDWQQELDNNISSVEELMKYCDLSNGQERNIKAAAERHPMNVPRYYLSLMDPSDSQDPIWKMAIPGAGELIKSGEMATTSDPYGDDKHDKGNGILHKYSYTALIVATDYCSMYCRHCFRKRMVGLPNDQTVDNFQKAAEYIRQHKEITNVVISGGDPLLIPTPYLRKMLESLVDIDHLNYVRIGSRTPVVYPLRFFDNELIQLMKEFNSRKALYLPTHFNHAREITPLAEEAIARVRGAGVTVNNQAVFLRGVNDSPEELVSLMNSLIRIGVNPYYLYQCMPVTRVRNHFQIPLKEGVGIVDDARRKLDGYAKRFKFIMGHDVGKIEICGKDEDFIYMKQIHSRSGEEDIASRMLVRKLDDEAGWLDDLQNVG